MSALIIDDAVRANLRRLVEAATVRKIDMAVRVEEMKSEEGMSRHTKQMMAQSVMIPGPAPFLVTYSVEYNHPTPGLFRHMSMSIMKPKRVPSPEAVWMVAEELGYVGGLDYCNFWQEALSDGEVAINLVQPFDIHAAPERVQ